MRNLIQSNRPVKVKSILPENTLIFSSLSGADRLSDLYEYTLELLSYDHDIDTTDLLGSDITIWLDGYDENPQYFHGYISDGSQLTPHGELAVYRVTLKPWLWFFTQKSDCRIFQDMNVPDILKDVFRGDGFTDFEFRLNASYTPRNYCVQYCESDFDFISRLMEHEGIYYYFKHDDGKHTLVLCDDVIVHETVPGFASVPIKEGMINELPEQDCFLEIGVHRQVIPGQIVANDFNFIKPGDNMLATTQGEGSNSNADLEIYDYSGQYPTVQNGEKVRAAGEHISRNRMEAFQATSEITSLEGPICGPRVGNIFTLVGAERSSWNREYLIVDSSFNLYQGGIKDGVDDDFRYNTRVSCIDSKVQFRAPRKTQRPVMQGPQTAIVVGPAGEEIFTDQYGRIKLQFHWDRYGTSDESSSCWVRVSQMWAGTKYGAIYIPRVNNEVIVEFINGDPDQPIVTGCVYNGDNKVPYELPANATQSGIKSRSSLAGEPSNFNEIRMEDKKGEEEFFIHAEKDFNQHVKLNRTESIGNDRSLTVGNNKTEIIEANSNTEVTKGDWKTLVKSGALSLISKKIFSMFTDAELKMISKSSMSIESVTDITLKVGGSQIVLTPEKVEISSAVVQISGATSVSTSSGGTIDIQGATVTIN